MTVRDSVNSPLQISELPVSNGVLGLTLCPGKHGDSLNGAPWARDLALDVAAIREWGATAVVTLLESAEFTRLQVEALPEAVVAAGMEWHHLPVRDVSVPTAAFERRWRYAGARLRQRLRAGERVLVHCRGGLGRAGIVAARLRVEAGEAPATAIAQVRAVRPGAIETAEQEAWVLAQQPVDERRDVRAANELAALLGGALGDAVGYRVEFQRWAAIERAYGPAGIQLAVCTGPLIVSDDTQMTLFTLEGMTRATQPAEIVPQVRAAYLEWLGTQRRSVPARDVHGRLARHPTLRHARAPGNTCLAALEHGGDGTVQRPLNDSKGCGGVMRTAPLGFLPAALGDATVFELGVAAAALTHGHPEGYLPAGAMAVFTRDALDGVEHAASVARVLQELQRWPDHRATALALGAAVEAAASGAPSRARVAALGEGWVGEEALAVGLYTAMTVGSFAECIALAANHDGDSDSTASIAGQLYGARHGLAALPAEAVYRLDVLEPLLDVFGAWAARADQIAIGNA
jgi:ADP-ribosylglycohydrolase/protein-tyrosine phosphatase